MVGMQMGKSLSAHQLHSRMKLDSMAIKVRPPKCKVRTYKGYTIKEWDELVPGAGHVCCIGLDNDGLAVRRGLDNAKEWIDADIASKQPKKSAKTFKVKTLKTKTKEVLIVNCYYCQGAGVNTETGRLCRTCKGTGEI